MALFVNTVFPNLTLSVFRVGQHYYGRWEKVQKLIQRSWVFDDWIEILDFNPQPNLKLKAVIVVILVTV